MILDILTPGDWRDSYDSRHVSFGNEVSCMQDVLNVLKCEFEGNKHMSLDGTPIYKCYDLYIYDDEGNRIADWTFHADKWEVEVVPPIEIVKSDERGIWFREPLGNQRYRIPVYYPERAYKSN